MTIEKKLDASVKRRKPREGRVPNFNNAKPPQNKHELNSNVNTLKTIKGNFDA